MVIPVYNASSYVSETIESLLRQTYPNLEIIAVDDGSKDDSLAILQRHQSKVRVLSQANGGQSSALNRGWGEARGEIIGYLGADDLLHPDAITKLVNSLLENKNAVAVYPDYQLIDQVGAVIREVHPPNFSLPRVVKSQECPPGPGLLFYKAAFHKAGPWRTDLRQIPDFDFLLRLGLQGTISHLQENLASFRVHAGSQSFAVSSVEKAEEPVRVMEDFFKRFDLPQEILALRNESRAYAHIISCRLHGRSGRWSTAMKHFISALRTDPFIAASLRPWRLLISAIFGRLYYRLIKGVNS